MFTKKLLIAGALTLSALVGATPSAMADSYGRNSDNYRVDQGRTGDIYPDDGDYYEPGYDGGGYGDPRNNEPQYGDYGYEGGYDPGYNDNRSNTGDLIGSVLGQVLGGGSILGGRGDILGGVLGGGDIKQEILGAVLGSVLAGSRAR